MTPNMSDDTPLTCSLIEKPPTRKKAQKESLSASGSFWKLKHIDIDRSMGDIRESSLTQIPVEGCVDDIVKQYSATVTKILEQHALLKNQVHY